MARDEAQIAVLASARERVLGRIADAAARVGRDPASVSLVAVSKTVPVDRLVAAVAAGLTTLGENRVQEAEGKAEAVGGATWHLVGPLQSNKVRRALEVFETIESVDSVELARRIDRLADRRPPRRAGPRPSPGQRRRRRRQGGLLAGRHRGAAGRDPRARAPRRPRPDDGRPAGRSARGRPTHVRRAPVPSASGSAPATPYSGRSCRWV